MYAKSLSLSKRNKKWVWREEGKKRVLSLSITDYTHA